MLASPATRINFLSLFRLFTLSIMLIPTHNYLVAETDGGNAFNSSSASISIPSIPSDPLANPHEQFHAAAAMHRRERRMSSAPYPTQSHVVTTNLLQDPQSVQGTDEFVFPDNVSTIHAPEPIALQNSLLTPNQIVQSYVTFAPGAHGTILDPFTPNPNAQSAYASFGELTATQIACMHAAGAYTLSNGNSSSDSRSTTPKAADLNSRVSQGQIGPTGQHMQQATMDSADRAGYTHIKVPQVPLMPPPVQPHAPSPTSNQGSAQLTVPVMPNNTPAVQHLRQAQEEPIQTFPTPSELVMQNASKRRRELEAPMREAETTERVRKAHRAEALNQGYTPIEPFVSPLRLSLM